MKSQTVEAFIALLLLLLWLHCVAERLPQFKLPSLVSYTFNFLYFLYLSLRHSKYTNMKILTELQLDKGLCKT